MLLLHLLLQGWWNIRKEGEKSLNDMKGNVNLPAIVESLLYLSFQTWKCEDKIIIALIKTV